MLLAILLAFPRAGSARGDAEPLVIKADTVLDPGKVYGPIVIAASNIEVDGRGAWVVGPKGAHPREYAGVGVSAVGVSDVRIRDLNVKGWETGLKVVDGSGWRIEGCDLSDNFHDPDFGWGENGRRGGIVLERVRDSVLRGNRANRVWDGCVLVKSVGNTLVENDFSHASNTCLKLWESSRNRVERNTLTDGIRIAPGEVHARDSTCVLIESGSNDNTFVRNDCRRGGDGIFVRSLNGWVSTGNVFEGNDCSYANNNGFECWSPRNVFRNNRADHCSYGFWLGASDQTRLEGNTASFNGLPGGNHNSPHLPDGGHAGIVFMFGPSSHTVARGNVCEGNNGAGIALVGDLESHGRTWRAFHWILERNKLVNNRWGIYASHADWVDLAGNALVGNAGGNIRLDEGVTRWTRRPDPPADMDPPVAALDGPVTARVGEPVTFSAARSADRDGRPLRFAWDLGDGHVSDRAEVEHAFDRPGFRRVGLTVTNGWLSDLAWRDLYVVDAGDELGTEGRASDWARGDGVAGGSFADDTSRPLVGRSALAATLPTDELGRAAIRYPASGAAGWSTRGKSSLVVWVRAINENIPAWQDINPVVTLHGPGGRSTVFTPKDDLMGRPPENEAREGWTRVAVPLAGDPSWTRAGDGLDTIEAVSFRFDSWGHPTLRIWLDGLMLR